MVLLCMLPHLPCSAAPSLVICWWPSILQNGVDITVDAPSLEGTLSRNAEMRHPRTAVGFSRDSMTLYLFAVDGRSENSGGMTLTELAIMMRLHGAWAALNFHGGRSTTMVVGGAVFMMNRPKPPGDIPLEQAKALVADKRFQEAIEKLNSTEVRNYSEYGSPDAEHLRAFYLARAGACSGPTPTPGLDPLRQPPTLCATCKRPGT